jgi:UDP-2,3-diacylglucosamine hydrolase
MVAVPDALPPASEWRVPDGWRTVDFISDLHLSAALPRTFEAWADYMRSTPADAVLILGDLFEFWPGSDAVQMAFEGRCAEVLSESARRRPVGVMVGNRDFLLTPQFLRHLGLRDLPDPTLLEAGPHRLLLTHGDALCLDDLPYQQFRKWTRHPDAQREFLAKPLHERVRMGAGIRHASEASRLKPPPPGGWADLDAAASVACLRAAGATMLIHGHTHRPGHSVLAPGFEREVLSDWDLDDDPPRAQVLRLRPEGLQRLELAQATAAG